MNPHRTILSLTAILWARVAVQVRAAAATAEALASGFIDNHGGHLGDAREAGERLEQLLEAATHMTKSNNKALQT